MRKSRKNTRGINLTAPSRHPRLGSSTRAHQYIAKLKRFRRSECKQNTSTEKAHSLCWHHIAQAKEGTQYAINRETEWGRCIGSREAKRNYSLPTIFIRHLRCARSVCRQRQLLISFELKMLYGIRHTNIHTHTSPHQKQHHSLHTFHSEDNLFAAWQ